MTDHAPAEPRRLAEPDWDRAASTFIDASSSEPLYRQLRRFIEASISSGDLRAGRPLPSSRYLAGALGVSRNTVSLAYQELIAMAVIESRPRSGLYPVPGRNGAGQHALPATDPAQPGTRSTVDWRARLVPVPTNLPHAASFADWTSFPYPFLAGQPEPTQFPVRAWLRALSEATAGPHITQSIQDSVDRDDPLLVDVISREILPTRGVSAEPSEILVTNGAQQALALIADALMDTTTIVALEDPGFRDAAHIFARSGASLHPIAVDRMGAQVPVETPHDIVYVTPSHHHPTNVTLSLARRRALLESARGQDTIVIEDDYDSEVRFRGRPTPALKALDRDGRVIYIGTFSKFVAPGLRMGFVVADPALIEALRERRRYSTKHPAGHMQRALGIFIDSGEYHRALRRHRNHLKRKWELISELLPETLGWELPAPPAGGLSIWAQGPDGFDAGRVSRAASRYGVLVDSGAPYYLGPTAPDSALRVGFSAISLEAIPAGLRALGRAVGDVAKEAITRRSPR
ncbi:MocR-like pyridoxine biosynthesis transcription factor PdxR [Homoserinibacter sp. YIM 151385]|uniref:MocR-like pyridoxine biosynthesis transcription factor PdxR n=1 Tax=Homoserinibacter sp. YIM 151385 TaxID=2985506 RepID=UPI0022F03FB4|nr:PLP-dependent aminotransferase family protein [Homoserinibacter sp. YIM 151385]WBU36725.1 PLP-dependent aminotransferase family protein [Homoserinibacter sp. YIM 151385]